MAFQDEVNTPLISVIGLFGAVVVFGIVVGLQVIYNQSHSQLRGKLDDIQPREISNLVAEQRKELAEYGYNAQTERYTIPVSRAMKLTVEGISAPKPDAPSKEGSQNGSAENES